MRDNELSLEPELMTKAERVLSVKGVFVNGLNYNSEALRNRYLRKRQSGDLVRVVVEFNKADLGYILIVDSLNRTDIKVCCVNFSYADGLTLNMHNRKRAACRTRGSGRVDRV